MLSREQFIGKLHDRGYRQLGSGYFSKVFAKPDQDKVIKVSAGDAYPDYVRWLIESGYAGTFGPKVYAFKRYELEYGIAYNVTVLERMKETVTDSDAQTKKMCKDIRFAMERLNGHGFDKTELLERCPVNWHQFIRDAAKAGMTDDLKTDNWMVRHDGSMVLTDPISYEHGRAFDGRIKHGRIVSYGSGHGKRDQEVNAGSRWKFRDFADLEVRQMAAAKNPWAFDARAAVAEMRNMFKRDRFHGPVHGPYLVGDHEIIPPPQPEPKPVSKKPKPRKAFEKLKLHPWQQTGKQLRRVVGR